jgi:DNA polymerase
MTRAGLAGASGSDEELKEIVTRWRAANPRIVKLWYALEKAALQAVKERSKYETHGVEFSFENKTLFMKLPSGRRLAYCKPTIKENKFGRDAVFFEGVGMNKKWRELQTYGGLWAENLVQATARDILFYGIKTVSEAGYDIVASVHDEIICEVPLGTNVDEINRLFTKLPPWAENPSRAGSLPLKAEGEELEFYRK